MSIGQGARHAGAGASTAASARACPERIDSTAQLAQLQALGQRLATPCGAGSLVWRRWAPPEPSAHTGRPTVLLLHGGAGGWAHWARTIPALVAAGREVLVPDLPGFGESASPPVGHDADALPAPVHAGLSAWVGDAALDIVGFSFGALVAAYLVTCHPSRAARLVLVGAPALSDKRLEPAPALVPWRTTTPGAERDAAHRHNLRALMLARDESADALALAIHARGVESDRMPLRRLMLSAALRDLLPRIPCPLGGIWGSEDVLIRDRMALLHQCLPTAPHFTALHLIAGAGHWVMHEAAHAFNAALIQLLGHERPASRGAGTMPA